MRILEARVNGYSVTLTAVTSQADSKPSDADWTPADEGLRRRQVASQDGGHAAKHYSTAASGSGVIPCAHASRSGWGGD